jgi:hypothetical protein
VGRGLRAIGAVLVLVLVAACSGGDDDAPAATLQTSTTAHTTTTLSVESQVEAAYLRSWDVYTNAVRTFDTSGLATTYTGRALDLVRGEVERLKAANTPLVVQVEHQVKVEIGVGNGAIVTDTYVNRNYRIDGTTKQPIDDTNDPGNYVERYVMMKAGDSWVVASIERQSYSP